VPHLTIAQLADEQQVEQIVVEFAQASQGQLPIRVTATENRSDGYASRELVRPDEVRVALVRPHWS